MAYISFQPKDYFNTVLHTGNGSELAVSGVGFEPDLTWIKNRSNVDFHVLTDTVRGATKYVRSNDGTLETTNAEGLKSFDSDGYTLGTQNQVNENTADFAGWNWKGATTAVPSGGTITPTACSFSATAGFGIYAYAGNATSGATIAHGLGAVPKMLIIKERSDGASWCVYHERTGNDYILNLNDSGGGSGGTSGHWNDTTPTSTVFTIGNSSELNDGSETYVAYAFADVKGYSKFGGYTGNGTADGAFIYTGFRPAFVLIKSTSGAGAWAMFDDKRDGYNIDNDHVSANTTAVEQTDDVLDIVSNGFKMRSTTNMVNGSGWTYVYMAFAKNPIVSSNGVPTVAR